MANLRPILAGNWKMNGSRASLAQIVSLRDGVAGGAGAHADIVVCPPDTLVMVAADLCRGSGVTIGGQDCAVAPCGPYTGDVSAEMLRDAGAGAVIVGHSERRGQHGETDDTVRGKAEAAMRARLFAIVCVGETRAERERGDTLGVIGRQIEVSLPPHATGATVSVAYEPIWAIGTGAMPSSRDILEVHTFLRRRIAALLPHEESNVRLLYGGSVKPHNAGALAALPEIDGLLVGGASLNAVDFLAIAAVYS